MSTLDAPAPNYPGLRLTLTSFGPLGLGNGANPGVGQIASWPVANTAYFTPIRLPIGRQVVALTLYNSSPVGGNIDLGIYSNAGTRIVSTGSVAQTGTNGPQRIAVTPFVLAPDWYYLAAAMDNAGSGFVIRTGLSTGLAPEVYKAYGLGEMASAFPLPATAVISTLLNPFSPHMALVFRGAP